VQHKQADQRRHGSSRLISTPNTRGGIVRSASSGRRLTNLPALRQIGFSANRRLLGVQRLSHDPITGAEAFHSRVRQRRLVRQSADVRRCDHPVATAYFDYRRREFATRRQEVCMVATQAEDEASGWHAA
jgi:hypothetical protein